MHSPDYWLAEADKLLERAEAARVEDPELSEVLFLMAQSAATLARGLAEKTERSA